MKKTSLNASSIHASREKPKNSDNLNSGNKNVRKSTEDISVSRIIIGNAANIITIVRILCSLALLFFMPLSLPFYALYIAAGSSDIFDGWIARKTNTATEFGQSLRYLCG